MAKSLKRALSFLTTSPPKPRVPKNSSRSPPSPKSPFISKSASKSELKTLKTLHALSDRHFNELEVVSEFISHIQSVAEHMTAALSLYRRFSTINPNIFTPLLQRNSYMRKLHFGPRAKTRRNRYSRLSRTIHKTTKPENYHDYEEVDDLAPQDYEEVNDLAPQYLHMNSINNPDAKNPNTQYVKMNSPLPPITSPGPPTPPRNSTGKAPEEVYTNVHDDCTKVRDDVKVRDGTKVRDDVCTRSQQAAGRYTLVQNPTYDIPKPTPLMCRKFCVPLHRKNHMYPEPIDNPEYMEPMTYANLDHTAKHTRPTTSLPSYTNVIDIRHRKSLKSFKIQI